MEKWGFVSKAFTALAFAPELHFKPMATMPVFLFFQNLFQQALKTSLDLFKITVPIVILTRFLSEWGLIDPIGKALAPLMEIIGLPGSMGLVWATAMVSNLYGGLVVFASLAPTEGLTIAQVTILSTIMLVAHSLPVELRIAQKAGPRLRIMISLRVVGALILGFLLHVFYSNTGYLQTVNKALWAPTLQNKGWIEWGYGELQNLGIIFLIILSLLLLMRILDFFKVTDLLSKILEPLLKLVGLSKDAAPLTIIGMTMGIGYGGGLLIQEARSGKLSEKDIFFSFCLLGLCHSIIEDTLLMVVIGGHLSGILWSRFLFMILITAVLGRIMQRLSTDNFHRYFFKDQP